jgi:hypothetical protein
MSRLTTKRSSQILKKNVRFKRECDDSINGSTLRIPTLYFLYGNQTGLSDGLGGNERLAPGLNLRIGFLSLGLVHFPGLSR